jgi:hypothetical protein
MQGLRIRGVQRGADYDTRRKRPPGAFGEDTDKAAYLHGNRVGRRMALHYRVSALGLLERHPRDSVVAVFSWSPLQHPCALRCREFAPRASLAKKGPDQVGSLFRARR